LSFSLCHTLYIHIETDLLNHKSTLFFKDVDLGQGFGYKNTTVEPWCFYAFVYIENRFYFI